MFSLHCRHSHLYYIHLLHETFLQLLYHLESQKQNQDYLLAMLQISDLHFHPHSLLKVCLHLKSPDCHWLSQKSHDCHVITSSAILSHDTSLPSWNSSIDWLQSSLSFCSSSVLISKASFSSWLTLQSLYMINANTGIHGSVKIGNYGYRTESKDVHYPLLFHCLLLPSSLQDQYLSLMSWPLSSLFHWAFHLFHQFQCLCHHDFLL